MKKILICLVLFILFGLNVIAANKVRWALEGDITLFTDNYSVYRSGGYYDCGTTYSLSTLKSFEDGSFTVKMSNIEGSLFIGLQYENIYDLEACSLILDYGFFINYDGSGNVVQNGNNVSGTEFYYLSEDDSLTIKRNGFYLEFYKNDELIYLTDCYNEREMNIHLYSYEDFPFQLLEAECSFDENEFVFVQWKNVEGADIINPYHLYKNSGYDYENCGASSTNVIPASGNGSLRISYDNVIEDVVIGLSNEDVDLSYTTINYAFGIFESEIVIYENGEPMGQIGYFESGDLLEIVKNGNIIRYIKNDIIVREVELQSTNDLLVDLCMVSGSSQVNEVLCDFYVSNFWTDIHGVISTSFSDLIKTESEGWGNAGAASLKALHENEDGWLSYKVTDTNVHFAVGFSSSNDDDDVLTIDHCLKFSNGYIEVYNSGHKVFDFGMLELDDEIVIERIGNAINYIKNGNQVYSEGCDPGEPLLIDLAMFSNGGVLKNLTSSIDKRNILKVNAGDDLNICLGSNIQLGGNPTVIGGLGNLFYSWTPEYGLNDYSSPNPTPTTIGGFTYHLIVHDEFGNIASDDVNVIVYPQTIITSSNATICGGTSVALSASGAISYSWTPSTNLSANNISNPICSATSTITYQVIGTDANGCSASKSISVFVSSVEAGSDQTVSPNIPFSLSASNASIFHWFPEKYFENPNIAQPIAIVDQSVYLYVYGISSGYMDSCITKDSIYITVRQSPTLTVTTNNIDLIKGESVQLSATGNGTFLWIPSDGLSNPTIPNPVANPESSLIYVVRLTDQYGGISESQVSINVYEEPQIILDNEVTVEKGMPIQLSAFANATSFSWEPTQGLSDPQSSSSMAAPAQTTVFTLTATNGIASSKKTITVNVLPPVDAHFTFTFPGMSVSFIPNYSHVSCDYSWNFGDGTTSNSENGSHTYLLPGVYNVCLTVNCLGNANATSCQNVVVLPILPPCCH
jgi:hypothetical protein